MSKAALEPQWGYFRLVLGMTRQLLRQFPDEALSFRPVPEARSAAGIVVHMYTFLADAVASVRDGRHVQRTEPEIDDKRELLRYADAQAETAMAGFAALTDEQVDGTIEAYGERFSGSQFLGFAYDEHWHHRGQLTVYLRLLGVKPLMIYDYATVEREG